ncbi:MAG: hypothetical protein PVH29_04130 [Candidatus Zixiibacteriota bacterium]|jgi:hypothetical protein
MRRGFIAVFAFVAAVSGPGTAAAADDGGLPAAFALMAGDGRTLGLGGAGVTLGGLNALYYNPAGLAALDKDNISSTYRALSMDRRIVEVGYGRPIIGDAGIGITWTNATVDDLVGTNYAGNPTEELTNSQNMFVFGFGRPVVLDWIHAGAAGRLYYSAIEEGRASGYGLDAGVQVTPWEWLTAAAAARDIATRVRWENTVTSPNYVEEVPMRGLFGVAVRPWPELQLVVQSDVGENEDWRVRGGGEYWVDERVALRAGYGDEAPTFGATVLLPRGGFTVAFDYAYVEEKFTASSAHTVSLGLTF